jgi:hypothetical protein
MNKPKPPVTQPSGPTGIESQQEFLAAMLVRFFFGQHLRQQLNRSPGVEDVNAVIITDDQVSRLHSNLAHLDRLIDLTPGPDTPSGERTDIATKHR